MLPRSQPTLFTILTPKWRTVLSRLRQERSGAGAKALLLAVVGLAFWAAAFGITYRILHYFRTTAEFGTGLAAKVLGTILLSFASVLLLSNLITALSSFFLSRDLDLLVSAPVDGVRLYLAKLGETLVHSSWMVVLASVPILTAYGIVYHGGWLFPFVAGGVMLPFLVLPAVIGTATTQILVNVFPARRTRDLLSLVAIAAAGGVIVLFRFIRPERLARPEGFRNLVDYITALQAPTSPLLPSEWAASMVMNWLLGVADPLPVVLLWTTAPAFLVLGTALHLRLFTAGFSKAQEGAETFVQGAGWGRTFRPALARLSPSKREFLLKDLRLFFRDTTQWSQLILLAVLLLVYLFNIRALPLFTGEKVPFALITIVVFLNQGLAGFVLAAVAARFVFPAISLEGRQMWLLRSSPLDLGAMLWSKYWIGTVPLLVLALTITIVTNSLLRATPFMMAVSVGTIVLLTLAISALALGFGAIFPQFETENAAQIPTSFGGLVFMMTTIALLGLVISIEAVPIAAYLRAQQAGEPAPVTVEMLGAFALVTAICAAATVAPLRLALRRVQAMEF